VSLPAPGDDRAALVTGASSGIGEAIARELARRGHQVVLLARNAERLDALAADLGPRAHLMPADLSQRIDRAALPGRLAALGLVPDILINSAGLSTSTLVAKSVPEQQLNLVEVDVAAVVDLCTRFLPGMVDRGRGAVLNVSSLGGFGPLPGQAAYGAAKAFILFYTESLRCELRGTGVTATALSPGPVDTGFADAAGFSKGEVEAVLPSVMWKSADKVAVAGIDGMAAGRGVVIPGLVNRLATAAYRIVPHEWLLPLLARKSPSIQRELRSGSAGTQRTLDDDPAAGGR
jgi:short-subunit dehydrogenase